MRFDFIFKTEIRKNLGKYLRQSYRRFEDVKSKPSQQLIDDAVDYLVKKNKGTYGYKSLSDDALRSRMEVQIKNLLDRKEINIKTNIFFIHLIYPLQLVQTTFFLGHKTYVYLGEKYE